MDPKQQKTLDCRIARKLQDRIIAGQKESTERLIWRITMLLGNCRQLERQKHRMELCQEHGYEAGLRHSKSRIRRMVPVLVEELQLLQNLLTPMTEPVPAINELVAELNQLRSEFGGYAYHHKHQTVSVTTDPIELQGEYLGPFGIHLEFSAIGRLETRRSYRVVAVDPHPAASDDGITHPHVSGEALCEGDATLAIRSALRAGRLADFFTLVTRVLNTYNGGSAYVPLSQWSGRSCSDCGRGYGQDEGYVCDRCEGSFCGRCTESCAVCERSVCRSCSHSCDTCARNVCNGCAIECRECEQYFCEDCITDGICKTCRGKEVHHAEQSAAVEQH